MASSFHVRPASVSITPSNPASAGMLILLRPWAWRLPPCLRAARVDPFEALRAEQAITPHRSLAR